MVLKMLMVIGGEDVGGVEDVGVEDVDGDGEWW
jgi:hypothetical protein